MTFANNDHQEVWVGLLVLFACSDCDVIEPQKGAYVNVLTWATSESEYRRKVLPVMKHYGLEVSEINQVEPLTTRLGRPNISEALVRELLEIADRISKPEHVIYGNFYTFPRAM